MKSRPPAPGASRARDGSPWKVSSHRTELLALYAEVDALLQPYSCEASTECCRFGVTGREPYPTAVERAEVLHAIRALGGGVMGGADSRRALPMASAERPCPLLSAEGRCRIYGARPFGCRTFFCERVSGPGKFPRQEVQRLSRAIADLSARFDPVDPHPRPLTRVLATAGGKASP